MPRLSSLFGLILLVGSTVTAACTVRNPVLPWTLVPPSVDPIFVKAADAGSGALGAIQLQASARDPKGLALLYKWSAKGANAGGGVDEGSFLAQTGMMVQWKPPAVPTGPAAEFRLTVEVSNGQLATKRTVRLMIESSGRVAATDLGAN